MRRTLAVSTDTAGNATRTRVLPVGCAPPTLGSGDPATPASGLPRFSERTIDVTDTAPAAAPVITPAAAAPVAPLSLLAVVAIVLAFVAPIGGLVVGFIARRDVRLTGERGDGIAFAAILIGATLTLFGIIVPLFLGGAGFLDLDLQI
jgi:hypothetical protein